MTVRLKLEKLGERESVIGEVSVRIVAESDPPGAEGGLSLTPGCRTAEELERALEALKGRLDAVALEARALFAKRWDQGAPPPAETPEAIWAKMEKTGDLPGMQRIFHELDEERRRQVADHVFTHANVFKGPASLFAQSYNEDSGLLG
jgi:hypothetical protein